VRTAGIIVQPMLEKWLREAAAQAGAGEVDPDLLGGDAVTVLLNLARDAAHGVARPAAPLATFALGLALGRESGNLDELRARAERVVAAANAWAEGEEGKQGQDEGRRPDSGA
jgi:Domain of unknown function (DUF6457)